MSIELDWQVAAEAAGLPCESSVRKWVEAALDERDAAGAEVTVRAVGEAEMAALNSRYRGKEGPTNVLSFPFRPPEDIELPLLGDLVICAPVVAREAADQGKSGDAHWAHMVVHGCLHLIGYDHREAPEAGIMESLERRILAGLGYSDPYA